MLLTVTTTHSPATDIGFLLEQHPEKVHEFDLSAGRALVFYPETSNERCTAALMLEIDPVGLVRSRAAKQGDAGLDQYVNDRPYVASSFLSVAIGIAFKSAIAGKSRYRPELADTPIPMELRPDAEASRYRSWLPAKAGAPRHTPNASVEPREANPSTRNCTWNARGVRIPTARVGVASPR